MAANSLIERNIIPNLQQALQTFRVAVLNGPRQSGKTTVVRQVAGEGAFFTLDDPQGLQALSEYPLEILSSATRPVVVDEIQRGGEELVRVIKLIVDEIWDPGQFLLTGSADFLTVPTISESLAGRAVLLTLHPLSQGEMEGRRAVFLSRLAADPDSAPPGGDSQLRIGDYMERICAGGYPEVVKLPPAQRKAWFASHVSTVTLRDVVHLTGARRASNLPRLLRLIAAGTAQELVASKIHDRLDFGNVQTTLDYLAHLEMTYLVHQLGPWSRNLTSRAKRRSKIYMADTGLAAGLLNLTVDSLSAPTHPARGQMVETFVVNEIRKQASWLDWSPSPIELFHYRDRNGLEADLMMELPDGRAAAVEVKASLTVGSDDLANLKKLRDLMGDQFAQGIVFYAGSRALPVGDRLHIRPIESLWRS